MPTIPIEILKESYQLRSTFFYSKLRSHDYFNLFALIQNLSSIEGSKLNWSQREQWKISDTAWSVLEANKLPPMIVFAHPKILQLHPSFLKYYRGVSMLSQKGLQTITGVASVKRIESGMVSPGTLKSEIIGKLISSINEVISLVVSLSVEINENKIQGMMFATAGVTIDGSWRNAVGIEGERVIRSIVLRELVRHNEVSSISDKQNRTTPMNEIDLSGILEVIDNARSVNLVNGYSLLFGSEPDVTMLNDSGDIVGAMEIKAGLDPAGALERLGAIFKSFENTLAEYPDAVTILVASCITDEVESRLGSTMLVK